VDREPAKACCRRLLVCPRGWRKSLPDRRLPSISARHRQVARVLDVSHWRQATVARAASLSVAVKAVRRRSSARRRPDPAGRQARHPRAGSFAAESGLLSGRSMPSDDAQQTGSAAAPGRPFGETSSTLRLERTDKHLHKHPDHVLLRIAEHVRRLNAATLSARRVEPCSAAMAMESPRDLRRTRRDQVREPHDRFRGAR
jgi:hypothetical protein